MKKKLEYQQYFDQKLNLEKKVNTIATLRGIIFIVMIMSFILKYYYYQTFFQIIFILSLIAFLGLIFIHEKYFKQYHYYETYLKIINEYLDRENGKWKNSKETGEEFLEENTSYLKDLDIIGQNSLFQYLSVCKTVGGKRKLFQKLQNPKLSSASLKKEQEAIEELANDPNWMINYQVEMQNYDQKEIDLSKVFDAIQKEEKTPSKDYLIAGGCTMLSFILLILGIFHFVSLKYFYGMFLFNYLISFMYTFIYQEDFQNITTLITAYNKIPSIVKVILTKEFHSSKLKKIEKEVVSSQQITNKINHLDTLNSIKDNLLFSFLLNGMFCINLFSRTYFLAFLKKDFSKLKNIILAIEELESMISLAGMGILQQEKCFPHLLEEVEIHFQNLKHPLLQEAICVPNDFSTTAKVNIITGSNMGGKTSFLRTIGINLILMNAGTYVCATSFSSAYLKIFTSMRVNDDIEKGISTFYGELLRIKDAMTYLGHGNMLVLIDEIFKGTNYQDRIYGAKKVIKRLQNKQVITILTTHDFELCDEKNISNYHVKEYYEGNKIKFDYKIRPGKCSSTNAKYLMEKLEII